MRLISFVKNIAQRWSLHDNTRSSAAIGFYAVFTLAPMLVFATALLGLLIGDLEAQSLTIGRLEAAIGSTGAEVAREVLSNADFSRHGLGATLISGLVVLYGASAIFVQLRKTLDRIFGRTNHLARAAIVSSVLIRLVAALCVIAATSLLVASLLAQLFLKSLSDELLAQSPFSQTIWELASTVLTVTIVTLTVVALLRFLPSQPPAWRHVLLGAAVSVVLFELGKWLFGIYVTRSMIASAYGPSSAIVAFILWIYYSTQIFILGAEVCQLSAEREKTV